MLYIKYISCGPHGFREEDFLSIISLWELYMGKVTLIYGLTICRNFQSSFNIRLHRKFEEIWPRGFREVVQMCEWMDKRTDRWTMDRE